MKKLICLSLSFISLDAFCQKGENIAKLAAKHEIHYKYHDKLINIPEGSKDTSYAERYAAYQRKKIADTKESYRHDSVDLIHRSDTFHTNHTRKKLNN